MVTDPDHEIDLLRQAATRLHAESWHDIGFLLSLQAQDTGRTDFDRHWLGREAQEASRYATAVARVAADLGAGNDRLDELAVQERVDEARENAIGHTVPTTEDGWREPGPPPWDDITYALAHPAPPVWSDYYEPDPDDVAGADIDAVIDDRAPGPDQLPLWPATNTADTGDAASGAVEDPHQRIADSIGRANAALARITDARSSTDAAADDRARGDRIARWQADDAGRDAADRSADPDLGREASS